MIGLVRAAAVKLRPRPDELYRLVMMETDPVHARRFEQLTPGPVLAFLALAALAVYGIASVPFRLIRRT